MGLIDFPTMPKYSITTVVSVSINKSSRRKSPTSVVNYFKK